MNERESLQAEFKWTHLGPHPYTAQSESGRIRVLSPAPDRSILALDGALTAFSQVAPRQVQAKVVELHYFGGLTEAEIVAALKISPRTVRRDWHFAKACLLRELSHKIGTR
jgi:hypothetical protein